MMVHIHPLPPHPYRPPAASNRSLGLDPGHHFPKSAQTRLVSGCDKFQCCVVRDWGDWGERAQNIDLRVRGERKPSNPPPFRVSI
jgi:hypothetical protein